ncbi:hypothetical protein DSO57_1019566 [Entomophthora muscae]|uniref:Uncharacterized protein n=1 Tax=Entomophthora muscae TaxID=34485 RepID=A0ACC2RV41_9FUNG|nr:hypothetical protein DSO57_1019566 [Entomophthora muscae]
MPKKVVFSLQGIPRGKGNHGESQQARAINSQLRALFKEYANLKSSKDLRHQLPVLNRIVSIYLQHDHLELEFMGEFSTASTTYFDQCQACMQFYHHLSISANDEYHSIKSLEALTTLYLKEKRFHQALSFAAKLVGLSTHASEKLLLAQAHKLLGDCHLLKGEETENEDSFKSAEKSFSLAYEIIKDLPDPPAQLQSETLINLGILGTKSGSYDVAAKYLNSAIKVASKEANQEKNPTNLARTLTNLAILFKKQESFGQAIHFIKQEIALSRRFKLSDSLKECYWDLIDSCVKNDDLESLPTILHELKDYFRTLDQSNDPSSASRAEIEQELEDIEEWQGTLAKIFRLETAIQTLPSTLPKRSEVTKTQLKLAENYAKVGAINLALKVYLELVEAYVARSESVDLILEDLSTFLAEINQENVLRIHQRPLKDIKRTLSASSLNQRNLKQLYGLINDLTGTIDSRCPEDRGQLPAYPSNFASGLELSGLSSAKAVSQVEYLNEYRGDRIVKVRVPGIDGDKELSIVCPAFAERSADFWWLREQAGVQFQKAFKAHLEIAYFFDSSRVWCLDDLLHQHLPTTEASSTPFWGEVTAHVERFSGYLVSDFKAAYLKKVASLNGHPDEEILKFFDTNDTLPSEIKLHGATIDSRALSPLLPFLSPQFYDAAISVISLSKTKCDDSTLFHLSKVGSLLPRLKRLDLSNTLVTSAAVSTVLYCFKDTQNAVPSLCALDLSFTRLDDGCLTQLVSLAEMCPSLDSLKLDGNDFKFASDEAFPANQAEEIAPQRLAYRDLKVSISWLRVDPGKEINLCEWLLRFDRAHPITCLNVSRAKLTSTPAHAAETGPNQSSFINLCLSKLPSLKSLLASNYTVHGADGIQIPRSTHGNHPNRYPYAMLELEELDLSYYNDQTIGLIPMLRSILPRCPNLKSLRLVQSEQPTAIPPLLHSSAAPEITC